MTSTLKTLLRIAALAGAIVAATAGPASAGAPCWKTLINDWYDGRIDKVYPVKCYRDALKHLPEDVETYSSARDDIRHALAARIQLGKTTQKGRDRTAVAPGPAGKGGGPTAKGGAPSAKGGGPTATGGKAAKRGGKSGAPATRGGDDTGAATVASPGRRTGGGPANDLVRSLGPKDADSVPIPLIVLAALAMLLLAVGAVGFAARRIQARRVPVRPQPPPPEPERPEQ